MGSPHFLSCQRTSASKACPSFPTSHTDSLTVLGLGVLKPGAGSASAPWGPRETRLTPFPGPHPPILPTSSTGSARLRDPHILPPSRENLVRMPGAPGTQGHPPPQGTLCRRRWHIPGPGWGRLWDCYSAHYTVSWSPSSANLPLPLLRAVWDCCTGRVQGTQLRCRRSGLPCDPLCHPSQSCHTSLHMGRVLRGIFMSHLGWKTPSPAIVPGLRPSHDGISSCGLSRLSSGPRMSPVLWPVKVPPKHRAAAAQ